MDFNRSSNSKTINNININSKQLSPTKYSSATNSDGGKSASEIQKNNSSKGIENGVNSKIASSNNQLSNTSNVATATVTSLSSASSSGSSSSSSSTTVTSCVDDPETIKLSNESDQFISDNRKISDCNNELIVAIPASYNEFINKMYDISNVASNKNDENVTNKQSSLMDTPTPVDNVAVDESNEEIKPLISSIVNYTSEKLKRPKSIVKSPSTNSFLANDQNHTSSSSNGNKPRLSLQDSSSNDRDRPVLHVQFSQNDLDESQKIDECNSPVGSIRSGSSNRSNTSSSSSSDDENSSIGQYSEARPPDGGWGWVVVFASFMVNLIADGVTFSFGIIYIEFLKYFDESKAKTSFIGSLFMATPLLSGPIASFLTDRYGCRRVTIAGSILACVGFVLSAFVNSTEMLFLTFGLVSGFGLSLCYVAAVVIVAYYFEKKRSFATGLSVCGSGIGTFIFAPLTQFLLDTYGWRGTLIIIGLIFLSMTVFGMLMRDLEWTTHRAKQRAKQKKDKMGISAESFSVSNSTNTGGTTNGNGMGDDDVFEPRKNSEKYDHFDIEEAQGFSSLINLPTFVKNGEKVPPEVLESLTTNKQFRNIIIQNYPSLLHSRSFSEPFTSRNGSVPDTSSHPQNTDAIVSSNHDPNMFQVDNQNHHHHHHNHHHDHSQMRPNTSAYFKDLRMHRHSLTYRGAMLNINRYRLRASSCPDIYRNSMTTIAKEKSHWCQGVDEFKNLFVDILDFSYFKDIRFALFTMSNFLLYFWYDVPYVYLADNAGAMGLSVPQSSMLISTIGIVNMVGEIFLGWFGDKKWINANIVYALCMLCCGVVISLVPLFKSFAPLSVISGLFGLFIAANYSLTSIILVELITLEKFTNAYGLLLLVQGIGNLLGPPLAGWIGDITESYALSFYLAGFFIVISGLILLILPAIGKYKKYKALKRQDSGNNDMNYETPDGKLNGTAILGDCFGKDLLKDSIKNNHV